jgi:hypothetical protein
VAQQSSLFDEESRYSIDTNVIVSFLRGTDDEYYGSDVFAPQWQYIEQLISSRTIIAARQVEIELKSWREKIVGMKEWLTAHASMFVEIDSAQLSSAKNIVNAYPIYGKTMNYLGDLTVMALAQSLSIAVLTMETVQQHSSQRRPKIPNVCREFGIDCVSVTGFLRRERFG